MHAGTSKGKGNGALVKHDTCSVHKGAMVAWSSYLKSKETGSVMVQLSSSYSKMVELNRYYIKTIAEIILFCAMHDMPLRGHVEDGRTIKKGLFLDFVQYTANHDHHFRGKMALIPNNAKYLSPDIQNEILQILSDMVLSAIHNEVANAKYYSVSADETRDNSKKELLSVVLRYYNTSTCKVKEAFTGLVYLEELGAESITSSLINVVQNELKLSLCNCVSSTFDGASTMSGAISGVQTRLKHHNPSILYTHCFNHVLNLCLVDTVRSVRNAGIFFELLQSLYIFISGSAIHAKFIEMQSKLGHRRIIHLKKQCETRWACRASSIEAVFTCFAAIVQTLQWACAERNSSQAVEARGLLLQICDHSFILQLHIMRKIFSITLSLSDVLQSKCLDLGKACMLTQLNS